MYLENESNFHHNNFFEIICIPWYDDYLYIQIAKSLLITSFVESFQFRAHITYSNDAYKLEKRTLSQQMMSF